jgi:hypothetical protein
MMTEKPDYVSYLLRFWKDEDQQAAWCASLECTLDGKHMDFSSLERLIAFLKTEFGQKVRSITWSARNFKSFL